MSEPIEPLKHLPRIDVHFDQPQHSYAPGDLVVIRYHVRDVDPDRVRGIEQSVVWYTEGKGEEDLGVHAFTRLDERAAHRVVADGSEFSVRLPASPLSYEGVIVKIRWCVRVRLFFGSGRDFVSEHEFEVGGIPPAHRVAGEGG
jgi:hypothetical protein